MPNPAPFLSVVLGANAGGPAAPGAVLISTGTSWLPYTTFASSFPGAQIGVALTTMFPGAGGFVQVAGYVDPGIFNLGLGGATPILAATYPVRGSAGQIIGSADAYGAICIVPSYVGVSSGGGGGSVTGVTGTAPIQSSGGTAPVISITPATDSAAGSMSAADKTKLDGLSSGVTAVTGTAPITSSGGATPAISITPATDSAAGSMSAADKTKLDGLVVVPSPPGSGITRLEDTAGTLSWASPDPFKLPLFESVTSTQQGATLKKKAAGFTYDPAFLPQLGAASVIKLHVLLETTNASNAAECDLFRFSGTGAPATITTVTTTSTSTTELVADVSTSFRPGQAAGIFEVLVYLNAASVNDYATISGAWLELVP